MSEYSRHRSLTVNRKANAVGTQFATLAAESGAIGKATCETRSRAMMMNARAAILAMKNHPVTSVSCGTDPHCEVAPHS